MQTKRHRAAPPPPPTARKKLQVKPLAGDELTQKRLDPDTKRKQKVKKQTARTYSQRPEILYGAVIDLGTPAAFSLSNKQTSAVIYVVEQLMACMEEHLFRDTMFKKNANVLRYDERLYLFMKAIINCIEFSNQSNNKPTEDQKLTFIKAVNRAIKLFRDTYKFPCIANPL